jgi:hypothetical protein
VDRAWDAVQAAIDGNGASQYAYGMWEPNADTGGSTGGRSGIATFACPNAVRIWLPSPGAGGVH